MNTYYDVIIIGGRIAGSVLASKLGDAGISALVIDKGSFPSNTLSTHYFRGMSAARIFNEIGILEELLDSGAPKLTFQVDFLGGTEEYQVTEVQGGGDLGFNLNISRDVLDNVLNNRVLNTPNVDFLDRTTLIDIEFGKELATVFLEVNGFTYGIHTKLVVGADGRNSTVASIVNPEVEHKEESHRIIVYQYYERLETYDNGDPDAAEFSLFEDEVAYFFPINDSKSLVAVSLHKSELNRVKSKIRTDFSSLFTNHPSMRRRIEQGSPIGKPFRSDLKENYIRKPYGDKWVLIGDSAIHVDPWSGLGIDFATIQASLLADQLIKQKIDQLDYDGILREYQNNRDDVLKKLYLNTVKHSRDMRFLSEKMKENFAITITS